jgi:methanogenic corrinoid protein MtbC1
MCKVACIEKAILSGNIAAVKEETRQWLESGRSVRDFQEAVLCPVVEMIRQRYTQQIFFIPELLVSLRAAKAAIGILDAGRESGRLRHGRIVVGSLSWNNFTFDCNVIVDFLEVCGWDVVDLGDNASPARLIGSCIETGASVLVVAASSFASGRLSPPVAYKEIDSLLVEMHSRGLRQQIRMVLVGLGLEGFLREAGKVDAICDDPTNVPTVVHQLATSGCA